MLYFAYGSNMSAKRIQHRCPSAVSLGTFCLPDHTLCFNYKGQDGSGKCNIMPTSQDDELLGGELLGDELLGDELLGDELLGGKVLGVVYDIDPSQIVDLDHAESLGVAYRKETMTVWDANCSSLDVFVYIAINTSPDINPYDWYKTHVVTGTEEANLPSAYSDKIRQVVALRDTDEQRRSRELAIYGGDLAT